MRAAYCVQQIRTAEEAMPELATGVLMQRAAGALPLAIRRFLRGRRAVRAPGARVLLVVGPGNNGGDALFAGARLARTGAKVAAWRAFGRAHSAAWADFLAAGGVEVVPTGGERVDVVVDGLLGIGGRPGLPDAVAAVAKRWAQAGVPVIAVDLPSGLDADSPSAPDSFTAELTLTFGALKVCQVGEPARSRCGDVQLVDIGLTLAEPVLRVWDAADVASLWPVPGPTSDKYSRGVVGIDAGSATYPGAGVLATMGAAHAGAGMVRFTGDPVVGARVGQALPNVVQAPGRVQANLLGCGWGERDDGARVVASALDSGLPTVVDADGLRYLPTRPLGGHVLLTPHAGELARLLGVSREHVTTDPIGHAHRAAERFDAVVLLKGATQYVASPGERCLEVAAPGPAWTAQAGSGDVLAGICATLLAAGLAPARAGVAAASAQALCAAAFPGPFAPQELAARLPELIGARFGAGR